MGKRRNIPWCIPLTLTGVMKGPKNRGKKKEIEVEEERRKERYNEPVWWKSPPQR